MSNKKQKIIITIYDIIVVFSILTTNWNDWGGIIMLPVLVFLVLLVNPILTWICFRKHENVGKIILVNYIALIAISVIIYFLKMLFV